MFPKEAVGAALARMRAETGASEAMILSTCNRIELYGKAGGSVTPEAMASFLCAYHGRDVEELRPYLFSLEGEAAVRHAFRVASSLDSMVIGEPQILGQVKEAYQNAEAAGTLGSTLNALRNR